MNTKTTPSLATVIAQFAALDDTDQRHLAVACAMRAVGLDEAARAARTGDYELAEEIAEQCCRHHAARSAIHARDSRWLLGEVIRCAALAASHLSDDEVVAIIADELAIFDAHNAAAAAAAAAERAAAVIG